MSDPPLQLWADIGPKSQGKIITAILQDREGEARRMLHGWSDGDLEDLEKACDKLSLLCRRFRAMRR